MKLFLLTAGSHYYPRSGKDDWIATFGTYEEAMSIIKDLGEMVYSRYKIDGEEYDWYEIIDLSKWIYESKIRCAE